MTDIRDARFSGAFLDRGGAVFNVRHPDFGAVGDGVADDTAALQAAANAARDASGHLLIAEGDFLIDGTLAIRTNVTCLGRIIYGGTGTTRVAIGRVEAPVSVSTAGLTGLVRGSTRIIGLTGRAGQTISLSSTEILTPRFGHASPYFKSEACLVITDDGDIWPPLDCTYDDVGNLTLTAYPVEPGIVVSGLRIRADNVGSQNSLVSVQRSHVTFMGLDLRVPDAEVASTYIGVDIRDSVGTFFDAPYVAGLGSDTLGYGIFGQRTAWTVINDGVVTECRHGFSGRHQKEVHINGGYYRAIANESPLDSHWANGFYVRGAVLEGGSDDCRGGVGVCGSNVRITDTEVRRCRSIAFIRSDTPELDGFFVAENNVLRVPTSTSYIYLLGMHSAFESYADFFDGYIQRQPEVIKIRGNTVYNPGDITNFTVYRGMASVIERTVTKHLIVEDNEIIGAPPLHFCTPAHLQVREEFTCDEDPEIRVTRQKFSFDTNTIRIDGDDPDGFVTENEYKYRVHVDQCSPVSLRLRLDVCREFRVNDSVLLESRNLSDVTQTPSFAVEATRCRLGIDAATPFRVFRSSPQFELRGCRFLSRMHYSSDDFFENHATRLAAMRLSIGNAVDEGVADAVVGTDLPPIDGYLDPAFYHLERNSGTATLVSGNTSVVVTHGLRDTPPLANIHVTPIEAWGSMAQFWVSNPTSTQFTINANADPTQDVDFAWSASVQ